MGQFESSWLSLAATGEMPVMMIASTKPSDQVTTLGIRCPLSVESDSASWQKALSVAVKEHVGFLAEAAALKYRGGSVPC